MVHDARKSPVNDPRKSPVPGWNSVKSFINKGRRTPEHESGRETPTSHSVDIFCDEESTAQMARPVKSVRPKQSRRFVVSDLIVPAGEKNRSKRFERSRQRLEDSKKHQNREYSNAPGEPTNSRRRRDRSPPKSRSPVAGQVQVIHKRSKNIDQSGVASPTSTCLGCILDKTIACSPNRKKHKGVEEHIEVPEIPVRPDSRASHFADDEEDDEEDDEDEDMNTIISSVAVIPVAGASEEDAQDDDKKKVTWHGDVKSCGEDTEYEDDYTIFSDDSTVSTTVS